MNSRYLANFMYDTKLGRLPKERPKEIYVKRKDFVTKKIKMYPTMLTTVQNNRKLIPAHRVIEEDFLAYREAFQCMAMMQSARYENFEGCKTRNPVEPTWLPIPSQADPIRLLPPIEMGYNKPHGYHYNGVSEGEGLAIPQALFKGPFDDMVRVQGNSVRRLSSITHRRT